MEEYAQDHSSALVHQGSVVLTVCKLLATSSVKMEVFVTRTKLVSARQDFMETLVKRGNNKISYKVQIVAYLITPNIFLWQHFHEALFLSLFCFEFEFIRLLNF